MAKTCTCGCNGAVFAKGVCLNAWRRSYQKPIKKSAIKKTKGVVVKKQTAKDKKVKKKLSAVKKEIELTAVQNNEYYCCGCGCSYPGLDKSHILSVGLYKHLELVPENIQLLCRSCHRTWEGQTIEKKMDLLCFYDNLLIIKKYDMVAWRKLNTEIESLLNNNIPT